MSEIYAQCHVCAKMIEVPSTWAASYIMVNQIPCKECYDKEK